MAKNKRRMPAHIVLPNGMWRFVKGKGRAKRSKRATHRRVKSKKRGFSVMARRKHSRRGSRGLGGGLGGISAKGILVGMGVAYATDGLVPAFIPYQDVAEGAIAGKLAKSGVLSGAIGGFIKTMLVGGKEGKGLGQISGGGY